MDKERYAHARERFDAAVDARDRTGGRKALDAMRAAVDMEVAAEGLGSIRPLSVATSSRAGGARAKRRLRNGNFDRWEVYNARRWSGEAMAFYRIDGTDRRRWDQLVAEAGALKAHLARLEREDADGGDGGAEG